jgi:hypothetical protein
MVPHGESKGVMRIEVRSKSDTGHRRLGKFFGLEPEIVEVTEAEAAVLESCTALLCRRVAAKAEPVAAVAAKAEPVAAVAAKAEPVAAVAASDKK